MGEKAGRTGGRPGWLGSPDGTRLLGAGLCFVSGGLDAISFLALGGVFASVMTGNLVFLGVSTAAGHGTAVLSTVVALTGYIIGVAVGSRLARLRPGGHVWSMGVSLTMLAEVLVLTMACAVWVLHGQRVGVTGQALLLGCVVFAMGMQGAAVRTLDVSVSTTYMTGALTILIEGVSLRHRFGPAQWYSLLSLVLVSGGALTSGWLFQHSLWLAVVVPAGALAVIASVGLLAGAPGPPEPLAHPVAAGVHVEAAAAHEARERDPGLLRQIRGQR